MTENEAKYYLLEHKPIIGFKTHNEALDIAIKCLEEIQQYRAIGTVESLKNLPAICDSLAESSEKAEKLIEELQAYRAIGTVDDYWKLNEMCKEYSAIGTIEEFKELKEKSVSKKVVAISLTHEGRVGNCPNCNNFVAENYDKKCPKCRIKLDWQ